MWLQVLRLDSMVSNTAINIGAVNADAHSIYPDRYKYLTPRPRISGVAQSAEILWFYFVLADSCFVIQYLPEVLNF